MTEAPRYLAYQVKTSCPDCGNPLLVNGPLRAPVCASCHSAAHLRPGLWSSIMGEAEKSISKLDVGEGYNSTLMTGGFSFEIASVKANFSCTDCEQEWDLDAVATGTDGTFNCTKCGHESVTYPAPPWLIDVIPTAAQIFFAERETSPSEGQVAATPDDASEKPIVFSCPQCAGVLKLTKESDRTVTCSYCEADVYLPDGLWLKLHPVKKAKYWCVRFEGDYQALKKAMKERKKAQKKAKKDA